MTCDVSPQTPQTDKQMPKTKKNMNKQKQTNSHKNKEERQQSKSIFQHDKWEKFPLNPVFSEDVPKNNSQNI